MKKSFTLIELLIVIGILAILAVTILVTLNPALAGKKARDLKRRKDLSTLQGALAAYSQDKGQYPSTGGSWRTFTPYNGPYPDSGANGWIPNLAPDYIKVLPHMPGENTVVQPGCYAAQATYMYISNGAEYKLLAHCGLELLPVPPGDPYYDPVRPTWAYQVSSSIDIVNTW